MRGGGGNVGLLFWIGVATLVAKSRKISRSSVVKMGAGGGVCYAYDLL